MKNGLHDDLLGQQGKTVKGTTKLTIEMGQSEDTEKVIKEISRGLIPVRPEKNERLGLIIGFSMAVLGAILIGLKLTGPTEFSAKLDKIANFSLNSVYPGLIFVVVGCIIIIVSRSKTIIHIKRRK